MKNIISQVILFIVALVVGFFCHFSGESQSETTEIQQEVIVDSPEIPQLSTNRKEQIIQHEGFTLSYNADYRIANWTAYELTSEKAKSNLAKRSEVFLADPVVKGISATDNDYRRSGYDRGHLVPAGDMKWSKKAMDASFYYSNICPQNRELNNGIWHNLEKQCRRWTNKYDKLLIITGPVIEKNMKRIGTNQIAVPNRFFKVICSISNNQMEGIGFLFENRNYTETSLKTLAIPIDSVETITGIDFFPSFSKEIQTTIESRINWKHWHLR